MARNGAPPHGAFRPPAFAVSACTEALLRKRRTHDTMTRHDTALLHTTRNEATRNDTTSHYPTRHDTVSHKATSLPRTTRTRDTTRKFVARQCGGIPPYDTDTTRHCFTRHDTTTRQHDTTLLRTTRHDTARHDTARHDNTTRNCTETRHETATHGPPPPSHLLSLSHFNFHSFPINNCFICVRRPWQRVLRGPCRARPTEAPRGGRGRGGAAGAGGWRRLGGCAGREMGGRCQATVKVFIPRSCNTGCR